MSQLVSLVPPTCRFASLSLEYSCIQGEHDGLTLSFVDFNFVDPLSAQFSFDRRKLGRDGKARANYQNSQMEVNKI